MMRGLVSETLGLPLEHQLILPVEIPHVTLAATQYRNCAQRCSIAQQTRPLRPPCRIHRERSVKVGLSVTVVYIDEAPVQFPVKTASLFSLALAGVEAP